MQVNETKDALRQAKLLNLVDKLNKQKALFITNPHHPSLDNKKLQPKLLNRWSFRLDKKYRARYVYNNKSEIEIYAIGDFHDR